MFAYSQNLNSIHDDVERQNTESLNMRKTIKHCIYQNILKNIHNSPESLHTAIQKKECKDLCNDVV